MRTSVVAIIVFVLAGFVSQKGATGKHSDEGVLPRLPGASLLVGTPPFFLMVTASPESIRLQPEYEQPETRDGSAIFPSFSQDGKVIAYARVRIGGPQRVVAISTYSATTDKHTDYSEGEYSGSVAISRDGSRLAFSAAQQRQGGPGDNHLHIINLMTGEKMLGPEVSPGWPVFASWSPDSRRLAYGVKGEIRIWDSDTGKVSKIADGDLPAWSPSGDWIAYLQGIREPELKRVVFSPGQWAPRCLLVRSDGTGSKLLIDLAGRKKFPRFFVNPPVWSPDSKSILFNEQGSSDTGGVDVHLVDIKTLKMRTIFKNSMSILGWAEVKENLK
jgi:Tol biopolymer transport system component